MAPVSPARGSHGPPAGAGWRASLAGLALGLCLAPTSLVAQDGKAFDQAFQRLFGPDSYNRSEAYYADEVARLKALLPADDLPRALKLFAAQCSENGWWKQDPETRIRLLEDGLRQADQADGATRSRLVSCEAWQRNSEGRDSIALRLADDAVGLARESGDPIALADALSLRANFRSSVGEQPLALMDYGESARKYRAAGVDPLPRQLILHGATAYRRMGDLTQAREHLQEFGSMVRDSEDAVEHFAFHIESSFLALDEGKPQEALREADRALEALPGDMLLQRSNAMLARARALVALERHAEAIAVLEAMPEGAGSPIDDGLRGVALGEAQLGLHRYPQALVTLDQAEKELSKDSNPRYLSMLYLARSRAHEAQGQAAAALADFREHVRLRDQVLATRAGQREKLIGLEQAARLRAAENEWLRKEKAALERIRRWQTGAILLSGLLTLMLVYVIALQVRRGRKLRQRADSDHLTGVASRAHMLELSRAAIEKAFVEQTPLCVLMLDVDHFKAINDSFGHPFGDIVLREITKACRRVLRGNDLIGRMGGEEFMLVCSGSRTEDARRIAERILVAVRRLPQLPSLHRLDHLSASIGIAELPAEAGDAGDLLEALIVRADSALYYAKRNGRDRVATENEVEADIAAED